MSSPAETLSDASGLTRSVRRLRKRVFEILGRRDVLYCLGDSHSAIFAHIEDAAILPATRLECCTVHGATTLGLANPKSKTNAAERFLQFTQDLPRDARILVMLGEVDCGYLIWYREAVLGLDREAEFERSLANYSAFLEKMLSEGFRDLIVCSTPPPCIEDHVTWDDETEPRAKVSASQLERTKLTARYNARMQAYCEQNGIRYLDLWPDLIDPSTGLVSRQFLPVDPRDHHLRTDIFSLVVANRLDAELS